MAVFGVDFGNLASVVSVARRGGIDIIVNEVSKRETSSLISFGDKSRALGEKASDLAVRNWKNTIGSLKRVLGIKHDSAHFKHESKFIRNESRASEDGFIEFKVRYKYDEHWFKPEQLIAMLFTQLREYAEREACEEGKVAMGVIKVNDCVVSCPAYYTSTQRKLLQQALHISGLNPLTLINETTAAALDWGIFKTGSLPEDEKSAQVVCFVDVGHSATTATVVSFMKGQLKVLGHVFDMHIGVRDFDYVLYEHFSAEIKKKYGIDLAEDKKNSIRLLSSIDKLKKVLSANALAPLNCEMGEVDVQFQNITREFAEELWAPMLANFSALMEKVKAIPGAENLFAVEILGGGSRIPSIKAALAAVLGKPVQTTLNASESVAKGCGIMGAMLSPKFKVREFSVIDSNVFTVNLGYHSEKSSNPVSDPNFPEINKKMVVLKPGDACPKTLNLTFDRTQDFELFVFNEACAEIGSTASDLLVGKWKVSQIPAVADSSVRVRLRISPSMLISVEGAFVTEELEEEEEVVEAPKSPKSPKEAPEAGDAAAAPMETDKKEEPKKVMRKKKKTHECVVSVLATAGHNEAKLKTMTDLEVSMVASDVNVRDTAEMKNSLEEYILSMRSKVAESGIYGPYMSEADRKPFLASCTSVEDWLYDDGDDAAKDDYAQKLTDLKRLGEPPVQRYQSGQKLVPAIAAFKTKAAELKAQAADPDGKLAHIPGVELHTVTQKCDECLAWLESEVARNAAAPKTVAPLLDASTVLAKQNEMNTFCLPILSTPKPKEEPKPEPPADAPAEGEKAEEKPADAKMDLD